MPPLRLYWCSTVSGDADYWLVARTAKHARAHFANENDYWPSSVRVVCIVRVPCNDPVANEGLVVMSPTRPDLERWGIHYNEAFHVFYTDDQRIFRPEGVVRALMLANIRKLRRAVRQAQE